MGLVYWGRERTPPTDSCGLWGHENQGRRAREGWHQGDRCVCSSYQVQAPFWVLRRRQQTRSAQPLLPGAYRNTCREESLPVTWLKKTSHRLSETGKKEEQKA